MLYDDKMVGMGWHYKELWLGGAWVLIEKLDWVYMLQLAC